MTLQDKKIVLAITGSIAAYKAAVLARLLIKQGAQVQVVMTPAARDFITPTTMAALTGRPAWSSFSDLESGQWHSHIEVGQWADLMLVAPATASTIGKMANGIADNFLVTCYLACKTQVIVVPAMDLDMYAHPSTTRNIEILRSYGNIVIEPVSGFLASGLEGKGRLPEPEEIVREVEAYFNK